MKHPVRTSFHLGLMVLALTAALALPVSASGVEAAEVIAPEASGTVPACCETLDGGIPTKSVISVQGVPERYLLGEEEMEEAKREARVDPELPVGSLLGTRPADGGLAIPLKGAPPRIRRRFDGLNALTASHEGIVTFPPDTIIAAGPDSVLQATNVALRLTDRNGNNAMVRSLNDFFGLSFPPLLFDPKVYYDRLSDRFFIVALSVDFDNRTSRIWVAVSRSANPQSLRAPNDWCSYRIQSRRGSSWADFPTFGMNERWAAIGVNNFEFQGAFNRAFLYALDKAALVDNAAACPDLRVHRFSVRQDGDGEIAFTVQPAQHYSTNNFNGTPLFMVSSVVSFAPSDRYTLWRLSGSGNGRPSLSRIALGGDFYSLAPDSPQDGADDLDTGDQRVLQAAYRDGELWAVHTTGCNLGSLPGESCIKAVRITPTATGGSITFEQTFGGGDGWFFWMPGIAINRAGDVVVTFQRSRGSRVLDTAFTGKQAGSPAFDRPRGLVRGRCGILNVDGGNRNRTGDYVGVQADPADDLSFWIAGEYAGNVGSLGCDWRTRVARVQY